MEPNTNQESSLQAMKHVRFLLTCNYKISDSLEINYHIDIYNIPAKIKVIKH